MVNKALENLGKARGTEADNTPDATAALQGRAQASTTMIRNSAHRLSIAFAYRLWGYPFIETSGRKSIIIEKILSQKNNLERFAGTMGTLGALTKNINLWNHYGKVDFIRSALDK